MKKTTYHQNNVRNIPVTESSKNNVDSYSLESVFMCIIQFYPWSYPLRQHWLFPQDGVNKGLLKAHGFVLGGRGTLKRCGPQGDLLVIPCEPLREIWDPSPTDIFLSLFSCSEPSNLLFHPPLPITCCFATGPNDQSWTENSKTVSQNKPFLFISLLYHVFVNLRKVTNTLPFSRIQWKKVRSKKTLIKVLKDLLLKSRHFNVQSIALEEKAAKWMLKFQLPPVIYLPQFIIINRIKNPPQVQLL